MRSKKLLALMGVVLAGTVAALFALRGGKPAAAESATGSEAPRAQVAPAPEPRPAPPLPQSAAAPSQQPDGGPPRPARPAAPAPSESDIMARIRELGPSNPAETLRLAREGNRRWKNSPDAPERASAIVRSLLSLDRREEAREEAQKMLKDYPGSSWTADVYRHMFVNPPTHPSERGYGKTLENQ